jgi:hypothetical protein
MRYRNICDKKGGFIYFVLTDNDVLRIFESVGTREIAKFYNNVESAMEDIKTK